jgi:hypothetical protein
VEILSTFVKVNIFPFLLGERAQDLSKVEVENLLLDLLMKNRELIHQSEPILANHSKSRHLSIGSDVVLMPLMKAYVKASDDGAAPKLPPVVFLFIYFIPIVISALLHENYFH